MEKQTKNHRYVIETGDYRKEENAETIMGAVISAFILKAPKNPAILTRIKRKGGNPKKGKEFIWHYIDTREILKKAGYYLEPTKTPSS